MLNAVITGCGKGIGRSIVLELARMNINVLGCARTEADLIQLQKDFSDIASDSAFSYKVVDLSDFDQVKDFGHYALSHFENVDILINNAGIFLLGSLLDEPEDQLETQLNINLLSAYHLTRVLAPMMKENGSGQIINICSIASKVAYPSSGSYAITKFALLGFTKGLRQELKDHGIRVNAILPGATWSNSWKGVELDRDRLMDPTEIAKTVRCCIELADNAVIEEIIIRPQLGDL